MPLRKVEIEGNFDETHAGFDQSAPAGGTSGSPVALSVHNTSGFFCGGRIILCSRGDAGGRRDEKGNKVTNHTRNQVGGK